ncbi:MAG: hypothetical protein AB7P04_15250 [Bacteriovoracia bacterium]
MKTGNGGNTGRRRWLPFWAMPVLIFMAVGTVWLRLAIVRTSYEIDQAEKQLKNHRLNLERLNLSIAKLRAPHRLESLAKTNFKLNHPRTGQVVYMEDSGHGN